MNDEGGNGASRVGIKVRTEANVFAVVKLNVLKLKY